MKPLRARGSAELEQVASGSATQGLWLRNGKVGSQVSGIDRREYTDLGEREEQVVCHASALAMTDEARREAET